MNLDDWEELGELSQAHHFVHYKEHKLRKAHMNWAQNLERKKDKKP